MYEEKEERKRKNKAIREKRNKKYIKGNKRKEGKEIHIKYYIILFDIGQTRDGDTWRFYLFVPFLALPKHSYGSFFFFFLSRIWEKYYY